MRPVEVGHALITLVEPHRDALRTYNTWYEHDHMYAGVLAGPGAIAGQRFAATRALKDLRYPVDSAVARPVDIGSFIALYWIVAGQLDEHYAWSFPTSAGLGKAGRMNSDRDHVATAVYNVLGDAARSGHPVPPHIALHHPYKGLVCVYASPTDGHTAADLAAWTLEHASPDALGPASGAAQLVVFQPTDFPGAPGPLMPGAGAAETTLSCYFLDADPASAWATFAELGQRHAEGGVGAVTLAAPFVPVVPGTETYLDELW